MSHYGLARAWHVLADLLTVRVLLLLLSAMLIQASVVLIGLGLLAEILTGVHVDGRHRRIYSVERLVPAPSRTAAPTSTRPSFRAHAPLQ